MDAIVVVVFAALTLAVQAGFFLLLPRVARRGLLFGVYVGEEAHSSPEASRITRLFYVEMAVAVAMALAAGLGLGLGLGPEAALPAVSLLPCLGFFVAYLRAYFRARPLGVAGPPAAVASVAQAAPASTVFPCVSAAFALGAGLCAIAYVWVHYPELPAKVPTHFGPSGRPDAWSRKSPAAVFLLPLLTLIMGLGMSMIAVLIAHAKRALRHPDGGVSLAAQQRFRGAMTRYLSVIAILVTALLAVGSVSSVRVAMGLESRLHPGFMVIAAVMFGYAIGGIVYIAIRYGQGGARLERSAAGAPLTDGLADNRAWKLGMFYYDPDDPSLMVEHRFGLGYTINFGNWKALALLGGFVAVIVLVTIVALAAM